MKATERTRDSRGRFVKNAEVCEVPEAGGEIMEVYEDAAVCAAPEEPVDTGTAALRRYGEESAFRLRAIADDPDTPVKLKADIERLFFEAVYGKGGKLAEGEGSKIPAVIKFEGELEEWAR